MKITKRQLKKIIKEEFTKIIKESRQRILYVNFLGDVYVIRGKRVNRDNLSAVVRLLMKAKEDGFTHVEGFDSYGSVEPIDETIDDITAHTLGF